MLRLVQGMICLLLLLGAGQYPAVASDDWVLVFEDHFKGRKLDSSKWIKVPYVNYQGADWRRYQSQDKKMYSFGGSSIKLWGRYGNYVTQSNQDAPKETYACGGIKSRGKFAFQYGRVEVKARFNCVQGCWPAIWMMPNSSPGGWPNGGEIDIMEHLNHEDKIYQTIHLPGGNGKHMSRGISPHPKIKIKTPRPSRRKNAPPPIAVSEWHVYGVIWTPQSITFTLDGKPTGTINRNISPKWPFSWDNHTFYLIIDQQIGGKWVEGSGAKGIDKQTLAKKGAVLEIDYVKVYSSPQYKHKSAPVKKAPSAKKTGTKKKSRPKKPAAKAD